MIFSPEQTQNLIYMFLGCIVFTVLSVMVYLSANIRPADAYDGAGTGNAWICIIMGVITLIMGVALFA